VLDRKTRAIRCQILRLNASNSISAEALPETPLGGAYCAPPDSLAGFKRPTSKERKGEGEEKGRRGEKGKGEMEGGEWRGRTTLSQIPVYATVQLHTILRTTKI